MPKPLFHGPAGAQPLKEEQVQVEVFVFLEDRVHPVGQEVPVLDEPVAVPILAHQPGDGAIHRGLETRAELHVMRTQEVLPCGDDEQRRRIQRAGEQRPGAKERFGMHALGMERPNVWPRNSMRTGSSPEPIWNCMKICRSALTWSASPSVNAPNDAQKPSRAQYALKCRRPATIPSGL